jgi:hypothetical protein
MLRYCFHERHGKVISYFVFLQMDFHNLSAITEMDFHNLSAITEMDFHNLSAITEMDFHNLLCLIQYCTGLWRFRLWKTFWTTTFYHLSVKQSIYQIIACFWDCKHLSMSRIWYSGCIEYEITLFVYYKIFTVDALGTYFNEDQCFKQPFHNLFHTV